MVMQLAGQLRGDSTAKSDPEEHKSLGLTPDLPTALGRLSAFKFIGLTDQYDLSVCLFHAKFGGACKQEEFHNMRPSNHSNDARTDYDEDRLHGYVDPYDTPLYLEAEKRFWNDVQKYNVGPAECQRICPEAKYIFQTTRDVSAPPSSSSAHRKGRREVEKSGKSSHEEGASRD